jgi:1-phosphofructokinase
MIYTVTFNPAIDYVVRIEKLEIGSVNRSREEALFYGGKGINVSTVLKNLGVDSVALGFVAGFTGDAIEKGIRNDRIITGFTGKAIEEGVAALGVKADFITVSDGVSRINVKLKAGEETEINGKGPNISDAELEELYKKLDGLTDGDCLVLAGAIPPSLPSDVYEKIMARLAGKKVDIVVDATKDLLLNVLKYHPFLIKPNNFELGEMFGVTLHSDEEIEEYAKKLQALGARNVAVSMAGDGSMLITETGETYRMGVPKGKVVNSVGAGDSMVAGFIASYFAEHDYKKALKYGAATGSATAFSEGLATKDQVEKLLGQF